MCSILESSACRPVTISPPCQACWNCRSASHGPDWSGVYLDEGALLVHERLAIVDQPVARSRCCRRPASRLAVNGEIYNHQQLKATLTTAYDFQTGSDCEVINALTARADRRRSGWAAQRHLRLRAVGS